MVDADQQPSGGHFRKEAQEKQKGKLTRFVGENGTDVRLFSDSEICLQKPFSLENITGKNKVNY